RSLPVCVLSSTWLASPVAVVVQIEIVRLAPAAIPSKHQPPSLVDPDRVEAIEMAAQLLEMVTGRRSQIAVRRRIVDHLELAEQAIFQVGRDFLRSGVVDEEFAQPVIPEAHDHVAASRDLMYHSMPHRARVRSVRIAPGL